MKQMAGRRLSFSGPWSSVVRLLLATLAGASLSGADKNNDRWRTLPLITGGKIDSNWVHLGFGGFAVDDGSLRTECDPRGMGLLVYKGEQLGNCQIRVVFKAKDAKSNAGVYVRIAENILGQVGHPLPPFDRDAAGKISEDSMARVRAAADREEGPWFAVHRGYEVQIADAGDPLHRTGAIYSLAASSASPKPGDWRTMIVTLSGERVSVDVDGKRVTDFNPRSAETPPRKNWYDPRRDPKRPPVGYIGLQNHDPGDVVWFKEVSVRPLPESEKR